MSTARKIELAPDEVFIQQALKEGRAIVVDELSMKVVWKPDHRFQSRVLHLNPDHVHRLDLIFQQSGKLAPIVVFRATRGAEVRYIVADGFHRHEVYRVARRPSIPAVVVDVPWDRIEHEAMLFAAMANQVTMLSRSKEDMRKAAEMLFADPEASKWSDARIAAHCGIGPTTVTRYRREFHLRNSTELPRVAIGRDGVERPYPRKDPFKGYYTKKKTKTLPDGTKVTPREEHAAIERDRRAKMHALTVENLCDRLLRAMVPTKALGVDASGIRRIDAFSAPGATVVPIDRFEHDALKGIATAIGYLLLLRLRSAGGQGRMICVCFHEDYSERTKDDVRELGVEFLTPDELVASLAARN